MLGTLMSQYGSPEKREAFVYRTKKGYHVDLYRATIFIRTVECHDHSESYAERVADNWIQKVLN